MATVVHFGPRGEDNFTQNVETQKKILTVRMGVVRDRGGLRGPRARTVKIFFWVSTF